MKLVDRLRARLDAGIMDRSATVVVSLVDVRAAIERIEAADPYARFGEAVFDGFWADGYPGDLDGGDLQEIARDCGLLGRTADHDAGATHAEGCEWQAGMPADDCDCWCPLRGTYRALAERQDGEA